MKLKKAMACMLAGAMALSAGAVLPAAAASEEDNTLTVWTWDPNFNIYAINKAAEIYAKDHEGFTSRGNRDQIRCDRGKDHQQQ